MLRYVITNAALCGVFSAFAVFAMLMIISNSQPTAIVIVNAISLVLDTICAISCYCIASKNAKKLDKRIERLEAMHNVFYED
jgi:multisubunit Na+/H+ antiporter MnhF subunit